MHLVPVVGAVALNPCLALTGNIDTLLGRVYIHNMTREFVYMPEFEKQWKETTLSDDDLKDLEIFLCDIPKQVNLFKEQEG